MAPVIAKLLQTIARIFGEYRSRLLLVAFLIKGVSPLAELAPRW
jgi:hypothetical protein